MDAALGGHTCCLSSAQIVRGILPVANLMVENVDALLSAVLRYPDATRPTAGACLLIIFNVHSCEIFWC